MVSCLIFKSLSHFEFTFVSSMRMCSKFHFMFIDFMKFNFMFIDLHAIFQLFQHYLLKTLFPILYPCLLCQRLIDHR